MKLLTPINIKKSSLSIKPDSVLTGIGSCFAEYVMQQFKDSGFEVFSNPNGIIYNSFSIRRSLEHISGEKPYPDEIYMYYNNLWHSWMHHGSFSSSNKDELINKIIVETEKFFTALKKAGLFILTPSSSVVYCLSDNNRIVANCHKYPGNKFYNKTLSVDENFSNLAKSIKIIKQINPDINIIITLSPVRHYPGNLILNSVSKANLLSAIHLCLEKYPDVYYFPSYEILLDELRDYRFYADDMLHPSDLARKIIYEKFITTILNSESLKKIKLKTMEIKKTLHKSLIKKTNIT